MAFFEDSSNSYSYFDDADSSRGAYDFSEMRSRPYEFEPLPAQNLEEYLINSFSGSFGLDSVASDMSNAEYDTLALVTRRATNSSSNFAQRKKSADSKAARKPSTPSNGAYANPADYFTDFLEAVPASSTKSAAKKGATPVKKVSTPGATAADDTADFKFGMQAFLHSQQLGFGKQPSFRRAGTEETQGATRRNDYFFGFDEKMFGVGGGGASNRGSTAGRRGSNTSRGNATAVTEPDMYKNWMDTLEASATTKLENSTLNRSTKSSGRLSRTPQTTETLTIAPEFKREVDFLMRGILGDIEVSPLTQRDTQTTTGHMWTNLDSFLGGSVTSAAQKPSTVKASAKVPPSPSANRTTGGAKSAVAPQSGGTKPAAAPQPVRTRRRLSDTDAPVATVHYAFPAPATDRRQSLAKESTVEDYFIDPSWVNGDTTPLSQSASFSGDAKGTTQKPSNHAASSGPTPSMEPSAPVRNSNRGWKRMPKPQVTTSAAKLVIASIPTNGLGTLQRSPTKDSQPGPPRKDPTPPTTKAGVPVPKRTAKPPRTPSDSHANKDSTVHALPFFPSSSTEALSVIDKRDSNTHPHGILSFSTPGGARNSATSTPGLQNRHASIRTDRTSSEPQSQPGRRRLSEFKTAVGDNSMGASFSVTRAEDVATQKALALERQKAAQKANEERKERVQAFLARRKKEKQESEQERLRQKESRESEQAKATSAPSQRAQNNATPPAGSAANAVRGRQRSGVSKPEPSRQSLRQSIPAAPYLEGDGILHVTRDHAKDTTATASNSTGLSVRGVLINVAPVSKPTSKAQSDATLIVKDASTVEVRCGHDSPRFFNVNEYRDYEAAGGKNLSSMTLSELVRKFLSGTNAALLFASTAKAESGIEAAATEVVSAIVRHRPASTDLYISTCLLYAGMTEDLLAPAGTALKPSTFVHSPTFGSAVDSVGYEHVQSARDVSKWVTNGFESAKRTRSQNRNAILVVSFILKQVKGTDVVLSSLLLTDAPSGAYAQVLRKLELSPYQLFNGVLGGPTFTVAAFAVTTTDSDLVQTLNTHHKLSSILNKPTHLGSLSAFKRLAEKEMKTPVPVRQDSASSRSSRRPQLGYWIEEADKALKNPTTYAPRPSPLALNGRAPAVPTGMRTSSSASPVAAIHPARKAAPLASSGQSDGKDDKRPGLTAHNSASMLSPKVSTQRLSSEAYINRGSSTAANYGRTGFINLDDSAQRGPGGSGVAAGQKTLPGATTVTADGPAWPAQQPIRVPPLVPTKSATEDAIITVASMSGSSFSSSNASALEPRGSVGMRRRVADTVTMDSTDDDDVEPPSATRVRTLVVLDPLCKESSNVTFENKLVIATTEDDLEEYDVDEVLEMNVAAKDVKSSVLNELCDTVLSGCNAALLGGDSRSYAASPQVLKIAVRRILNGISQRGAKKYGNLSVSIVKLKGKTMTDLLVPNSEPKKVVVAISPIFGSCVHGVEFKQIASAAAFDTMLKRALDTVVTKNERDVGFICCSFILKLKLEDEKDVLVSSLIACFAGENVGLYTSVLDQSPLVPRALFHYALGGPCFTVSLLGIGGDEARANLMLQVQRSLGQTNNRVTHPGSISKFVGGIRNELAPAMMQKLQHGDSDAEREKTREIVARLMEIVKDAEALLKDFDNHEPKAYLNADEDKDEDSNPDVSSGASTGGAPQGRRSLPALVVKDTAGGGGSADSDDSTRVRSLVCLEERMMGGGSVTVSDSAAVLVKTRTGGVRFDADEVITRNGSNTSLDSTLIDNLVNRFLRGHHTGLLTADSSNCAFTPLMLRKIVYQVVGLMQTGLPTASGKPSAPITGELRVSMALIKDGLIADLLPIEEDAEVQPFSVEYNPIAGPVLASVVAHLVPTAEDFDRFLAIAIDNADPSLQTDDPGMMVVSLALTQRVTQPKEDVLVSSLLCTAVFDAVYHYAAVLSEAPEEPLDLFRFILGGASYTVALMGVCDEDESPDELLSVLGSLAAVRNRPSYPNSVVKYIADLQQSIMKLHEVMAKTTSSDEKNYIKTRLDLAEQMLREAETVLRYPLSFMNVQQQNQLTFVPLGSSMPR